MAANKKNLPIKPAAKAVDSEESIRIEHEGRKWNDFASEGSVRVNRVNALANSSEPGHAIGAKLSGMAAIALVASLAFSLGSGLTATGAVKGWATNQLEINKWAAGAEIKSVSQAMVAATTKSEDYAKFVADVVANPRALVPQATGPAKAGTLPCVPMDSLAETWLNPATGTPDRPRCKFSGDSIFVASFVQDAGTGRPLIYPVLGVFHQEGGAWSYYNFDGGLEGGIFALRDQKSVSIYQIASVVDKAFPGSMVYGDVTAPRTALARVRKLFDKKP